MDGAHGHVSIQGGPFRHLAYRSKFLESRTPLFAIVLNALHILEPQISAQHQTSCFVEKRIPQKTEPPEAMLGYQTEHVHTPTPTPFFK